MKTKMLLIGGFLGAGKTTLLNRAADLLRVEGKQAGLITNDQASALVDTALLLQRDSGEPIEEVSGSCFCCNFPGLEQAMAELQKQQELQVILAEPVGSCTDLSATILQPLKQYHETELSVAPLSVLVDPWRIQAVLEKTPGVIHESAAYIVEKQLEEADMIVINKIDALQESDFQQLKMAIAKRWPQGDIFAISAQTGDGVAAWLNAALERSEAGQYIAKVDYDIYAEGEAVLGWLNMSLHLAGAKQNYDSFLQRLMENLSGRFDREQAAVGHAKAFLEAGGKSVIGNITGRKETLNIRGSVGYADEALLTVNARVEMDPDQLKSIVLEEMKHLCGATIATSDMVLNCLKPGRPNPTHRFSAVI